MTLFEFGVFAGEAVPDYGDREGSGVIIPSMTSVIRKCVNYARDTRHIRRNDKMAGIPRLKRPYFLRAALRSPSADPLISSP